MALGLRAPAWDSPELVFDNASAGLDASGSYYESAGFVAAGSDDQYWSAIDWTSVLNNGIPRIIDTVFGRPTTPNNAAPKVYQQGQPISTAAGSAYGIPGTVWLIAAGAVIFLLVKD